MTIFFVTQGLRGKLIIQIARENEDNRIERIEVLELCRPMF